MGVQTAACGISCLFVTSDSNLHENVFKLKATVQFGKTAVVFVCGCECCTVHSDTQLQVLENVHIVQCLVVHLPLFWCTEFDVIVFSGVVSGGISPPFKFFSLSKNCLVREFLSVNLGLKPLFL